MEEGGSYNRKAKSLGLLCQNFLGLYGHTDGCGISLDDASSRLGVERRRIYDVVNVFESLELVGRAQKNRYQWNGLGQLQATLDRLKQEAEAAGGFATSSAESDDDEQPGGGGGSMARKKKSLCVLAQKFVQMFLVSATEEVALDDAAQTLMGSSEDPTKRKTKVRRLYDIANILTSLGLIEKQLHHRKPAFRWLGAAHASATGHRATHSAAPSGLSPNRASQTASASCLMPSSAASAQLPSRRSHTQLAVEQFVPRRGGSGGRRGPSARALARLSEGAESAASEMEHVTGPLSASMHSASHLALDWDGAVPTQARSRSGKRVAAPTAADRQAKLACGRLPPLRIRGQGQHPVQQPSSQDTRTAASARSAFTDDGTPTDAGANPDTPNSESWVARGNCVNREGSTLLPSGLEQQHAAEAGAEERQPRKCYQPDKVLHPAIDIHAGAATQQAVQQAFSAQHPAHPMWPPMLLGAAPRHVMPWPIAAPTVPQQGMPDPQAACSTAAATRTSSPPTMQPQTAVLHLANSPPTMLPGFMPSPAMLGGSPGAPMYVPGYPHGLLPAAAMARPLSLAGFAQPQHLPETGMATGPCTGIAAGLDRVNSAPPAIAAARSQSGQLSQHRPEGSLEPQFLPGASVQQYSTLPAPSAVAGPPQDCALMANSYAQFMAHWHLCVQKHGAVVAAQHLQSPDAVMHGHNRARLCRQPLGSVMLLR